MDEYTLGSPVAAWISGVLMTFVVDATELLLGSLLREAVGVGRMTFVVEAMATALPVPLFNYIAAWTLL